MDNDGHANEILPRLWLGNRRAAEDDKWLIDNNIKTIFNCTKQLPFSPVAKKIYRLPVDDNREAEEIKNMTIWGAEAVYKVIKEYKAGETILIHCHAGMQRSAALMAMVLIALLNTSANEAIRMIKTKRRVAFLYSINFEKSIRDFEFEFRSALK
jgi:protein tyrosine phosphatase